MNILEQAISAAGGVTALAKILNLEPNVVSNWRARGIPASWETALILMQRHSDGAFSHDTNVSDLA
jgi:hypothetical protein